MAKASEKMPLEVAGRVVEISNPQKVLFPEAGYTKLDVVKYYVAVAEGALRGAGGRPNVLVRYPNGIGSAFFFQKRAPEKRPEFIEVTSLHFPSGNVAAEVVPRDAAALAWMANLGCLELHPHPVRAENLEHPDELRVDLDPVPGVPFSQITEVAKVTRSVLEELGLQGFVKTSGSRGIHMLVRIEARYTFPEVRRAALALAREVERRAPTLATSKWWKEERHGVFLDYNQNAKDRTVASAYSVRPKPDARVSTPVEWDELDACDPADFTLRSMPARYRERGDPHAAIDARAFPLEPLIELSAAQEREGQGDAPWPPHYRKQAGEPPRVRPSHARTTPKKEPTTGDDAKPAGGKRVSKRPLIEIGRAKHRDEALAGVERWKAKHPEAAAHLAPEDVLVDSMRGRHTNWTRIRINLVHVPLPVRPKQEALDPDDASLQTPRKTLSSS
jgi:DNA ligase D-like protein (predicted polymerase)